MIYICICIPKVISYKLILFHQMNTIWKKQGDHNHNHKENQDNFGYQNIDMAY